MKRFSTLFILLLLIIGNSNASVKTSVVDGNWSNPSTWSPSGVPFSEDTLIINTHVIADVFIDVGINWLIINAGDSLTGDSLFGLHGNLKVDGIINIRDLAVGDGTTTINNGIIKGDNYATGNNTYANNGCIYSDTLATSETNFTNDGIISSVEMATSGGFNNNSKIVLTQSLLPSGTFNNNTGGGIEMNQGFTPSGNFTNHAGAIMIMGDFTTGSSMTNDGEIICAAWTHGSGTFTGTNGKVCIAGCFLNSASITGTLDVCDASPSTICDMNLGTIAPSVTLCAVSPCATTIGAITPCTITVGIDEMFGLKENSFSIYPNPTTGVFNIIINDLDETTVQIIDVTGKTILSSIIYGDKKTIDFSNQSEGIYFLKLTSKKGIITKKIVVNR